MFICSKFKISQKTLCLFSLLVGSAAIERRSRIASLDPFRKICAKIHQNFTNFSIFLHIMSSENPSNFLALSEISGKIPRNLRRRITELAKNHQNSGKNCFFSSENWKMQKISSLPCYGECTQTTVTHTTDCSSGPIIY